MVSWNTVKEGIMDVVRGDMPVNRSKVQEQSRLNQQVALDPKLNEVEGTVNRARMTQAQQDELEYAERLANYTPRKEVPPVRFASNKELTGGHN